MALRDDIAAIQDNIRAGRFLSEAAVSSGIVLRVLSALGWPVFDTERLWPEYSLSGRRVDFALCHPPSKATAFIEVKQVGQSEGAERQLFEYAFHESIPLAILTDGQSWSFFLPGEQGAYGDRRVYKLDLLERSIEESVSRLERYLSFSRVTNGLAIASAREDYQSAAKLRQVESAIPQAWRKIIEEQDDLLVELIADRVELICGFRPDPDSVSDFLRGLGLSGETRRQTPKPAPRAELSIAAIPRQTPPPISPPYAPSVGVAQVPRQVGFFLDGQFATARNAKDVLEQTLRRFQTMDQTFLERFASLSKHGRSRRYVAQDREKLYPGRPDLCADFSSELPGGWWFSTNHSKNTIKSILEMACEVTNRKFGYDYRAELGD